MTVDFLIPVSDDEHRPGTVKNLETDFGALVTPGLQLVKRDRREVALNGTTLDGTRAKRNVWVCGPAAYVVLKARAIRGREKDKDAYDLCYVLQCYADRPEQIAIPLAGLLDDLDAQEALAWLNEDFAGLDYIGPRRYAQFLTRQPDDDLQRLAQLLVQDLLSRVREGQR